MKSILKKTVILVLLSFFVPCLLHARAADENGTKPLTIFGLKGPSGVGIIRLFDNPPKIPGFDVKVEALAQSGLVAARLISGEAKIGILPPDVAAKIASSGKDLRAAAVIGAGMLSLLCSDPGVRTIEDLRGKNIEVAGQGTTPYHVFRRILAYKGLDPDRDLKLGYSLAYPEIALSLISGKVTIALLPEPFATMALMGKPDLRTISDIQEEWIASGGGRNFPITLLVVDGSFADANPAAVAEILAAVKSSIEWIVSHPVEAGVLSEKHELGLKAAVVTAAIPKSNYVFIPAAEARPSLEALYKVFLENAPASIGGALPGNGFYLK